MIKKAMIKVHDNGVIEEVTREQIVQRIAELQAELDKSQKDLVDFDAQAAE